MKTRNQGRLKSVSRSKELDLGLAISGALLRPGQRRTQQEIADFCDCSRAAISIIERTAIQKLRRRLQRDQMLAELVEHALAA